MATNDTKRALAGAKALIAGIEARIAAIDAQAERTIDEFNALDVKVRGALKELNTLKKERQDLEALRRRYVKGYSAKSEVKEGASDERPGSTAVILGLLETAPDRQLPVDEIVQRVEAAIKGGHVRTNTTDARKLASSVIGNLVRQGRLLRHVHDDGRPDMVVLAGKNGGS